MSELPITPKLIFSLSLSLSLSNPRCLNTEGKKLDYVAMGAVAVYRTGTEFNDIPAVWDWRRIPGTTTSDAPMLTCSGLTFFRPVSSSFVGGVSTGSVGATAITILPTMVAGVQALKSCFFHNSGLACFGSAITSPNYAAYTTVANRLLQNSAVYSALTSAPSTAYKTGTQLLACPTNAINWCTAWAHHDNTGYFFYIPVGVTVSINADYNRTGTWQDVGMGTGSVTADVLSITFNHGIVKGNSTAAKNSSSSSSSYGYMVLPGYTLNQTQGLALQPPMQQLQWDNSCHATASFASSTSKTVSAVFWKGSSLLKVDTSIGGWRLRSSIDTSHPCLLAVDFSSTVGSPIKISVSNPDIPSLDLVVNIDGQWKGPGATVYNDTVALKKRTKVVISVNSDGSLGATESVSLLPV